ncbi:MAG: methionine adenosyltransferase [Candidatus Eisenbacteria bacterium]|uniref:S-adenosylmethionine synthase n=1 Tax=Eiseniibacteriota bacterium TaxID=2212470 RepID=A0A956LWR3_UNCEI|nr:methionine adenosyltransferase [Candidatus Eisenbacteria bacterium]
MAATYGNGIHHFTSESVSIGHPDKVCDQISDAILDSLIKIDPRVRCACETLCTTGLVVVAGEVTVDPKKPAAIRALDNVEETVRGVLRSIGYTDPTMRFDAESCAVIRTLHGQSENIARGVNRDGAGDQGLMFGYACRETPQMMPMPIQLSHELMKRHVHVREKGIIEGLRPDAKSQVTIEYDGERPRRVHTVVLSTQHTPKWSGKKNQERLREQVLTHIVEPVMPPGMFDRKKVVLHVNPTGEFEIGGPHGDTGLTGRKIIVDSYGGRGSHGGGAFSGKDPTKVDRSAAYMARYIAKNVVASGLADVCEVQLAYAIGVAQPLSVLIDTQGTARVSESLISEMVREFFPLTPRSIIDHLKLRRPIYRRTAMYGHFGSEPSADGCFRWERTDLAAKLKKAAGRKQTAAAGKAARG